jgi:arylsulfatase A-like enzyme
MPMAPRLPELLMFSASLIGMSLSSAFAGQERGTRFMSPHPNLEWPAGPAFAEYRVEIALDEFFNDIVDRDTIANVSRYVPADGLPPGRYFHRVYKGTERVFAGEFQISAARHQITIRSGSGMREIRSAVEGARSRPNTRIVFEPGTYDLYPGDDGTVFDMEGVEHLIIDGNGAKLVIHDIARLARLRFSRDITVRNFTVDYAVPLYTAAKVEKLDKDGAMELSLLPGHVPPETVQRFMEEKRGMFYDPRYPRMAEDLLLLIHMRDAWKRIGDNRYRLQAVDPQLVENVKPGMVYVCAPRYRPQGIELYNSENITLADVTTHYLPGIGVVTSFAHELKLIRFNMLRREDRLLGVQNGGTNIRNARIGPWVEGCRFENTGDDSNHISALTLTPLAQPEPNRIIISPNQPGTRVFSPDQDIRPGDRLAFFDRPSGTVLAEAKVMRADRMPNRTTQVVVDQELPPLRLADGDENFPRLQVTQIYNLDRACGNFVFRNNTFIRGRRIGILAKSGPGLIENNRFEELGGGGVEIWNAPFEGLHAHDILIRNNLFRRNGITRYTRNGAGAAIWTQVFSGNPSPPLHRNIHIVGNEIVDHLRNGIEVHDAHDIVIEGNRFANHELDQLRVDAAHLIEVVNTRGATIRNNEFQDTRFSESRYISVRDSSRIETVLPRRRKGPPNIILILLDDLGYADLSCQGSPDIRTPNIDRLAAAGVRFTAGYVPVSVCGPSRASLLTGRYSSEFGVQGNNDAETGLPLDQKTIAEYLKTAGYATQAVGKWHLGYRPEHTPLGRGFDEFIGHLGGSCHYFPFSEEGNQWNEERRSDLGAFERHFTMQRGHEILGIGDMPPETYLTDLFSDEAVRFIEQTRESPFLIYLSYNAPHSPIMAPERYLQRNLHIADENRRIFAGMMTAVDDGVGRIMGALERRGIAESTMVVLLSDNGGPTHVNTSLNTPFRGQKGDVLEGGIRVPYMISWPDVIPGGQVFHDPVSALDILPTFLHMADIETDAPFDGVNLLPWISGGKVDGPPHEKFYFWRANNRAIRVGDAKLTDAQLGADSHLFDLRENWLEDPAFELDDRALKDELSRRLAEWERTWSPKLY